MAVTEPGFPGKVSVVLETFRRSGQVGADLAAVDWSATPLGPLEQWPPSLEAAVRLVLTSRFSMWMAWGPELTFFCNDSYRRDTLGTKYPWALGRPASEVWSEIWADIGPRIEHVMATGEATWDEKLMLLLERSGYREETYHTFSYSPLADDEGRVAGMLCVVSEDTEEVISRRRMATLRDLGTRTLKDLTEAESIASACRELATSAQSLPFTLTFLYDDEGVARLAGETGVSGDPDQVGRDPLGRALTDPDCWPHPGGSEPELLLVDVSEFSDLPTGAWSERPIQAATVTLHAPQNQAYGFMVFGLNPYRLFDDDYADFLELVAGQVAEGITAARALEFERRRAEELSALDRSKTDFFTNVSHEFRTPLTLLLAPAEDALADGQDPLPPRQRERVETIHRSAQRLLKLVNTLLDFSRLESGRVGATFEPVDLAAYTRELASMFETAARRLGLVLEVRCEDLPEPVHVDRELWGKVVLNLVSNALKFTLEGRVEVSVRADDDGAVLTVADTGSGIPQSEQEQLFERFHRVPGTVSRSHEGSGIGLALVGELAALHGGRVTVRSELGVGSTFEVHVPFGVAHLPADLLVEPEAGRALADQVVEGFLAEADQLVARTGTTPTRGLPARERAEGRAQILIVDDNPDIRQYVSGLLAPVYDVRTAEDGREGLELARRWHPDLVLTDVMMPGLDGFELLAALQQSPETTGIPVVMLSARAGEEGLLEGLEAGADDYLAKPFTARELLARVRANLELDRSRRTRRELERSQAMLARTERLAHIGSWEIDLASGKVVTSEELRRLLGLSAEEIERTDYRELAAALVHPDDQHALVLEAEGMTPGETFGFQVRLRNADGVELHASILGEVIAEADGRPSAVRGSVQDITEAVHAAEAEAMARAAAELAAREHAIASELQASLMPQRTFDLEHLAVATYYGAGVEGTEVGGDWYDVIELASGRTAFVVGDVMGRGVSAAAVMGQIRSAVRAYAHLGLHPEEVLKCVDGLVGDLGNDQIVTCVYAVFDPITLTLRFANAGHLPPLLAMPDGSTRRLGGSADPPLGAGFGDPVRHEERLAPGSTVLLYTDGLVERRGEDLDAGITDLEVLLGQLTGPLDEAPEKLVQARLPDGQDDDVAVLVARVELG